MNNDLFSVIVLHYNQPRYVMTALSSVLSQDYENIELVFADDASTSIDLDAIDNYINENKKDNIKNVIYSVNEENIGTVKTINRAVKKCSGKYILFFAADDALHNEKVISNFVKAFSKAREDVYMISSQCYMMDINLEKKLYNFVKPTYAMNFNKFTAQEQYKVFCNSCFLAIGATAMRKEMFLKYGYFNEEYKFVEDWSYFLYLTRNGGRIEYSDFEGLLHRDGGVSHYADPDEIPPHVISYRYDIVRIFENEILPYVKKFDSRFVNTVYEKYKMNAKLYLESNGTEKVFGPLKRFSLLPFVIIKNVIRPILSNWNIVLSLIRFTALISLIFVGCVAAILIVGNYFGYLFSIVGTVLAVLMFICIISIFGLVLGKLAYTVARKILLFIRGLK